MAKRIFDIFFAMLAVFITSFVIIPIFFLASFDTKSNGIFAQKRIGRHNVLFKIYKIRTMNPLTKEISAFGKFLRKSKLDELPQLINVLKGEMTFVGPRPDIPGYYDKLQGEERNILKLRPGITSEASIKYRNEEYILKQKENPLEYNDQVIFPDKVKMNLDYYYNNSFLGDIKIIIKTFIK